jgi:hypothetical protein
MFIVIVCISFRQAIKDGDLPRKRKTAHLAIKTNGLLKHVSLSGTSLFSYHRGVSLGWRIQLFKLPAS